MVFKPIDKVYAVVYYKSVPSGGHEKQKESIKMRTIETGKYKHKTLAQCPDTYIVWASRHEKNFAPDNRWVSRDAKIILVEMAQAAADAAMAVKVAEQIIAEAMEEKKTMKTEKYQVLDIMDDGKSLEIMKQGSFLPGCIDVDSSLVERASELRIGQFVMLGLSDDKQWNDKKVVEIA